MTEISEMIKEHRAEIEELQNALKWALFNGVRFEPEDGKFYTMCDACCMDKIPVPSSLGNALGVASRQIIDRGGVCII